MARRISAMKMRSLIQRMRKQSNREIQRETGTHRTVVRTLRFISEERGWLQGELPSEAEVEKAYAGEQQRAHVLDEHREKLEEWRGKGFTYESMEKQLGLGCSQSVIRHYMNSRLPKAVKAVMVRKAKAGECMDVDFGYLGIFWDPESGRNRKLWFFSGRLRYSRRAYREVVFSQNAEVFFMCHVHAFEFFGGVPKKVVLDNLKAGVIRSCIDNDFLNRVYLELAEHYEFMISPCRPRKPQHKGGVESDVGYVKSSFLPLFRETGGEPQLALEKWGEEVDQRKVSGVGRTPLEMFAEEELLPLPDRRWEHVTWVNCQVRREWRIQYQKAYYSVPYKYIGKKVQVRLASTWVRIFYEHEEIACHRRATEEWEYKRIGSHAPPYQEEVLQCSKEGLLALAERIGPRTQELVEEMFADPRVDRLRPVRCLLKLAKRYSEKRLEAACERALEYQTIGYVSVKRILEKDLDEPAEEESSFRFARQGSEYTRREG